MSCSGSIVVRNARLRLSVGSWDNRLDVGWRLLEAFEAMLSEMGHPKATYSERAGRNGFDCFSFFDAVRKQTYFYSEGFAREQDATLGFYKIQCREKK
jgi:hypothetical protein